MNTTTLAYLGDAIYELMIREHVIRKGIVHSDRLHLASVRYVRADAQAEAIREIYDSLPEDEQALVRRAKNRKISTKPKNATPMDYKWATAFEALLGYYHLCGNHDALQSTVEKAIEQIEGLHRSDGEGKEK
jgi:ribonuclease-3 family protein